MTFRPMLSAKLKKGETYEIELPRRLDFRLGQTVSGKVDGIRIACHPELGPVTRALKPIPNKQLRAFMEQHWHHLCGMDLEFTHMPYPHPDYSFQKTFSHFSSHDKSLPENFRLYVFDSCIDDQQKQFRHRLAHAQRHLAVHCVRQIEVVKHHLVHDIDAIWELEKAYVDEGWEGIMLKHPYQTYKYNRATMVQQQLTAVKRMADDEAIIIGFEPLMRNHNEAQTNALGYTERSAHAENKIADDLVGRLRVRGADHSRFAGVEFHVGSGFDEALRKDMYENFDRYKGRMITYKYQDHGIKDKPRACVFKSFREDI